MNFDPNQDSFSALSAICSESTNPLIFFTGAGLSAPAMIPVWGQLRNKLIGCLEAKAEHVEINERSKIRDSIQYAASLDDLWLAFELIKKELGETSYSAAIREAMSPADNCTIPHSYQQIWKLRPAGILNLNLDRLVARAHSLEYPGARVDEFNGKDAGKYVYAIKSEFPFIGNLHGVSHEFDSWVFTRSEVTSLLSSQAYRTFVTSCFASRTVVFCGISADDSAVGGFLEKLKELNINAGDHFWITNRNDQKTVKWAEDFGLRTIFYKSQASDHSGLNEILQGLIDANPLEELAKPIVASESLLKATNDEDDGQDPELVEMWDIERLRVYLNRRATKLLVPGNADSYRKYEDFCREYDAAIHRAWYAVPETNRNTLFGYTLKREIGRGAFGTVFETEAPDGTTVALKLLHESVRSDPERLQSFRRGVRSMKILQEQNVPGVVAYKMAAEIPAMAIMDFVPGENLANAVQKYGLSGWRNVLRVMKQIVGIVRTSHKLPQRVLHRDLRPHNVMIANPWDDPEDWDVLLLDFDLSWHRDAQEVSIETPGVSNGYLPPEMMYRRPGVSTRSALVDSFGLATVLFFMVAKRDPLPMEPLLPNWRDTLSSEIASKACPEWQSLPRRIARLIRRGSASEQNIRLDVAQFEGEVDRLLTAIERPGLVEDIDLWAEELAKRSSDLQFVFDDSDASYLFHLGGLDVKIRPVQSSREIIVDFNWQQVGNEHYKDVRKWITRATDQINSQMRGGGWTGKIESSNYQIIGGFSIRCDRLQRDSSHAVDGLKSSILTAQFEG